MVIPAPRDTEARFVRFEPEIVTLIASDWLPEDGLMEETVGELSATVKAAASVPILPSEVVTVRFLAPMAAPAATVTSATIWLALMVVVVAETPVPEKATDEPLVNFEPLIVTETVSP